MKRNVRLPREAVLGDGSYLTTTYPSEKDRRHRAKGIRVRAVEYRLEGVAGAEPLYRLVMTILDPAQAPAADLLAALYHERWEIDGALAELKTPLRRACVVLRGKTPELVRQEFWGLLLAHFAVRGLMHEAALRADEDPDRLSFLHAVGILGAGVGGDVGLDLALALGKAALTIALIYAAGRLVLRPVLRLVAQTRSPETFMAAILLTVIGASSNTRSSTATAPSWRIRTGVSSASA